MCFEEFSLNKKKQPPDLKTRENNNKFIYSNNTQIFRTHTHPLITTTTINKNNNSSRDISSMSRKQLLAKKTNLQTNKQKEKKIKRLNV